MLADINEQPFGTTTPVGTPSPGEWQWLRAWRASGGIRPDQPDSPARDSIPPQLTSFIGREAELQQLRALLEVDRLITIVGTGGVGKTRLVSALAGQTATFVGLAGVREARFMVTSVARALGISDHVVEPSYDAIAGRLADQEPLLILDNLEQIDTPGDVIRILLNECPDLRIVATSRCPLRISGERRFPLRGLPAPTRSGESTKEIAATAAIALFLDRARYVDPAFVLDDHEAAVVGRICRRLEGNPLAIELAAARLDQLTPDALEGRLDSPLEALARGPVDAAPRHSSMRASVAWSYGLLDPPGQRLIEQAGVFVGAFGLQDAVEVLPDSVEGQHSIEALLGVLVDHGLLIGDVDADARPRYRLPAAVRAFARERLSRSDAVFRRHTDHYARLVQLIAGAPALEDEARVRAARAELDAALGRCIDAAEFDTALRLAIEMARRSLLGRVQDARTRIERLLLSADAVDGRLKAEALRVTAQLAAQAAEFEVHDSLVRSAILASAQIDDSAGVAATHLVCCSTSIALGHWEAAAEAATRALVSARASSDPRLIATAERRLRLTRDVARMGTAAAIESYARAPRFEAEAHERGMAWLDVAHVNVDIGRPGRARGAAAEARRVLRRCCGRSLHGTLSLTTALIEAQQGRSDIAREHLIAGLDAVIERGVVADGLFGLEVAAEWFGTVGLHGDAVATWDSAHRLRRTSGLTAPPVGRTWVDRGQARDRRRIRSHQRRAALDDVVALSLDGALHRARKLAAEARSVTRVDSTRADREARRFHPTPREAEVLGWLVDGFSDREIAERLFISPKTVSVHVSNLKGKLEASSRIDLAMTAIRQGWARPTSALGAPTLPDLI